MRHAVELVEPGGREALRDVLLLAPEEVHGEPPALDDRRVALGLVRDANEDQRRIERDRGESAGREPGGAAIRVAGADHRDAAREVAENLTKVVWRNHQFLVADRAGECKAVSSVAW